MSNFLVTVKYDPGVPKSYAVQNVQDARSARAHVLGILGYDPGVPVEVTRLPIHKNKVHRFSNLGRCMD
jgi:hypothetical protein